MDMAEDNKRKALYNQLTQDGYDLGDFDSFNNNLSDGEKRRSLYDAITEDGYDVGEWDAFNRKLDDGVFWEKQDFSDLMEQNKLLGAELNETKDRFQNRMKYLEGRRGLQVKPVKLGQNSRVVKVASEENGDMGKNGPAYITESGNRYDIREQADFEQNAVEMARHDEQNREDIMLADIDNRIASLKDDLGENGDSAKTVSDVMGIVTGGMMGLAKAGTRMVYDKVIAPLIGKKGEQDRSVMKMALDDLEQARTTLERNKELRKSSDFLGGVGLPMTKDFFNNWKNFSYGIWDTLHDGSLYDMGVGEAGKAAVYLKMKNKMDRGEELNDQEMRLALAGMARAEAEQMADLPEGYRAGKITAQMVPFMVQMAVNPASGFGRSLARKAVRNFGRNGLKAVTARVGGRIAGNVGEAAVLANTLQAGQTAANIVRRHVGEFELNGDGQVVTDGGKGIGQSIYEGEVSNIIENFTELGAGGALNKLAGKITKKAALSKLGERMGLSKLSEFVGKVGSTPFARRLNALKKKSNWNGLIEEPLEEEYGIALNSLLATGDNEWSDFLDSEQQKDIFAGTMWFGGFMSTLNMGVYPIAQRRMRKDLGRADARGFAAFGAEWSRRKDGFDVSDRQIVDALSEIRKDKDLNDEQKAALFDYAVCLTRYQGSNVADMLMRMEDGLSQEQKEVLGAYERGASEEGKDGMNDIQTGYDASRLRLHMLAGEETLKRIDEGEDFVAIHDNLSLSGNIEGAQAVLDYVNARSARMGMMDRVRDDMEDAVLRSDAMVDRRTDKKDGMVKPVVLSTGRRVYVVGGNVVMLPDGEAVDRGVSDDMLIVVDEETGRVESVPSEWVLRMEDSTDGEQM